MWSYTEESAMTAFKMSKIPKKTHKNVEFFFVTEGSKNLRKVEKQ